MLYAVIMAGGSGTRFWPLSRKRRPKQFLNLLDSRPMLVQTLERMSPLVPRGGTYVATSRQLLKEAKKIAGTRVPKRNWIAEPIGRNTAPCLALAAFKLYKRDPNAVMICLPADHLIKPKRKFQSTLRRAVQLARDRDVLVLLGIRPRFAATGFGYIRRGAPIKLPRGKQSYLVKAFVEKPNARKARALVASDRCFWNSGIFVWKASVFLDELNRYLPKHYGALSGIEPLLNTSREGKALKRAFLQMSSTSVDYGVMQRSKRAAVIPADFEWDDVGDWTAASRYWPRDANRNAAIGRFYGRQTVGATVCSTDARKLVAVVGLRDVIVVDTEDALLVCSSKDGQAVRQLVEDLAKNGCSDKL